MLAMSALNDRPKHSSSSGCLVIIDNYDSFVYNIVHWLKIPQSRIRVLRNDAVSLSEIAKWHDVAGIIISPGPMSPAEAGISNALIAAMAPMGVPILGICLGHQCIGHVYGGRVERHPKPMHGKASLIKLENDDPLFDGLPSELLAGRYHSLHVVDEGLDACGLRVTARNIEDGTVMALRHKRWPVFGVQFHPESILTGDAGRRILDNFAGLAGQYAISQMDVLEAPALAAEFS